MAVTKEGLQKVGFEGSNLCFDWHGKIAQLLHDADFTTSVSLDSLRQIKSAEELACIRKAMAIGDEAFIYSELKEVIISEGIKKIGSYSFAYCWNLNKLVIPESVENISSSAWFLI